MKNIKMVIDYSNMAYTEVLELPCDTFSQMFKNAYIDMLNQSEEGRKHLADCERLQNTKMDVNKLRNVFGK